MNFIDFKIEPRKHPNGGDYLYTEVVADNRTNEERPIEQIVFSSSFNDFTAALKWLGDMRNQLISVDFVTQKERQPF